MDKTMKFEVNENEASQIINALASLPYRDSYQLIAKLQQQAVNQKKGSEEQLEK